MHHSPMQFIITPLHELLADYVRGLLPDEGLITCWVRLCESEALITEKTHVTVGASSRVLPAVWTLARLFSCVDLQVHAVHLFCV